MSLRFSKTEAVFNDLDPKLNLYLLIETLNLKKLEIEDSPIGRHCFTKLSYKQETRALRCVIRCTKESQRQRKKYVNSRCPSPAPCYKNVFCILN